MAGFVIKACTLCNAPTLACLKVKAAVMTHPQVGTRTSREALFDLPNFQQLVTLDQSAQLADNCDMLADVPAELAELGVLLYEALHVRY